jgi:tetratricopeptide (TPR) repeat protein
MNIVEKIKALLKEAELYHSMGLLNESMGKYKKVTALIQSNEQLKSRTNLIAGITKKINALEKDMHKVEAAIDQPEVSAKVQDLIKKLFTASEDKDQDTVALDGAIALAKFGQHERALVEFKELLAKDSVRVVAAKNIIRCHMANTSVDAAVDQYEQWLSSDLFVPGELNKLRFFLESILKKEGIVKELPTTEIQAAPTEPTIDMPVIDEPEIEALEIEEDEDQDDEVLDINSIGITLDSGPQKGNIVELDVSFQAGNVISLLITHTDTDLIEQFNVGETLHNIQFYSAIAMFGGSCIVDAKTHIESGPRRGDYSIDLKVVST